MPELHHNDDVEYEEYDDEELLDYSSSEYDPFDTLRPPTRNGYSTPPADYLHLSPPSPLLEQTGLLSGLASSIGQTPFIGTEEDDETDEELERSYDYLLDTTTKTKPKELLSPSSLTDISPSQKSIEKEEDEEELDDKMLLSSLKREKQRYESKLKTAMESIMMNGGNATNNVFQKFNNRIVAKREEEVPSIKEEQKNATFLRLTKDFRFHDNVEVASSFRSDTISSGYSVTQNNNNNCAQQARRLMEYNEEFFVDFPTNREEILAEKENTIAKDMEEEVEISLVVDEEEMDQRKPWKKRFNNNNNNNNNNTPISAAEIAMKKFTDDDDDDHHHFNSAIYSHNKGYYDLAEKIGFAFEEEENEKRRALYDDNKSELSSARTDYSTITELRNAQKALGWNTDNEASSVYSSVHGSSSVIGASGARCRSSSIMQKEDYLEEVVARRRRLGDAGLPAISDECLLSEEEEGRRIKEGSSSALLKFAGTDQSGKSLSQHNKREKNTKKGSSRDSSLISCENSKSYGWICIGKASASDLSISLSQKENENSHYDNRASRINDDNYRRMIHDEPSTDDSLRMIRRGQTLENDDFNPSSSSSEFVSSSPDSSPPMTNTTKMDNFYRKIVSNDGSSTTVDINDSQSSITNKVETTSGSTMVEERRIFKEEAEHLPDTSLSPKMNSKLQGESSGDDECHAPIREDSNSEDENIVINNDNDDNNNNANQNDSVVIEKLSDNDDNEKVEKKMKKKRSSKRKKSKEKNHKDSLLLTDLEEEELQQEENYCIDPLYTDIEKGFHIGALKKSASQNTDDDNISVSSSKLSLDNKLSIVSTKKHSSSSSSTGKKKTSTKIKNNDFLGLWNEVEIKKDNTNKLKSNIKTTIRANSWGLKMQRLFGPEVWKWKWIILSCFLVLIITVSITTASSGSSNDQLISPSYGGISNSNILIPSSKAPSSGPSSSPTNGRIFYSEYDVINGQVVGDKAGQSVSMSANGRFVAVGFPQTIQGNGKVQVFEASKGEFIPLGNAIVGPEKGTMFGYSVSLSDSGEIVAIGAPDAENNHGVVMVYKFNSKSQVWDQLGREISSSLSGGRAGSSVSLSGDGTRLVVGIPRAYNRDGVARIYEYTNLSGVIDLWVMMAQEIKGSNQELLGLSVSLNERGDRVAIGAVHTPGPDNMRGSVYVLSYDDSWKQIGKALRGSDLFGRSVSLSSDGNRVAIGSTGFDTSSQTNVGRCMVYEYSKDWAQLGQDIPGQTANERNGVSVVLSRDGERLACAGQRNSIVRVFKLYQKKWEQVGDDLINKREINDGQPENSKFGAALGMNKNGKVIAVGAPGTSDNTGMVGIYQYSGYRILPT